MTMWFKMPLSGREGALLGKWVLMLMSGHTKSIAACLEYGGENTTSTMQFQLSSVGTDIPGEIASIAGDLADDNWHFLAARFAASSAIELSIDGSPWAQAASPGSMYAWSQPVYLFDADQITFDDWNGTLEDVRIYAADLSDEMVDQIHASYLDH